MLRRVKQIAGREAHTLALSEDGNVGRGTFTRLGTGKEHDEHSPVRVYFPETSSLKKSTGSSVPSGKSDSSRTLFVGIAADDGSVWSWDYNAHGQLGHRSVENASLPCLVQHFQQLKSTGLKVHKVNAGAMLSFAIDTLSGLWMWGSCPQPSNTEDEGFGFLRYLSPRPVMYFHGRVVVKVACGNEHVVALVQEWPLDETDPLCYSWGSNNHGQLGLGDTISRSKPEIIRLFDQEYWSWVFDISCGAFHTALLTERMPHDKCWTFGLGDNGQLGHGTTMNECFPRAVKGLPEDMRLCSVVCGLFHTSVATAYGNVWSWGMEKGLGLCPDASLMHRAEGVKQVACGAAQTLVVTDDGHEGEQHGC